MNSNSSIVPDKSKIEQLASQILLYKELYYLGRAAISDEAYDELEKELRTLDAQHPALSFVGYKVKESASKVRHQPLMLSLSKTYKLEELTEFVARRDVVLSDKVDGMALALEYDFDGRLIRASTRGSGSLGEDVTSHVMHVLSLPKHISTIKYGTDLRFEMRGEIYFPIQEFGRFSERFDSYRNAVPGTFGRKDVDEAVDVLNVLRFRCYDVMVFRKSGIATEDSLQSAEQTAAVTGATYFQKLSWLSELGFDTGLKEQTTRLIAGSSEDGSLTESVAKSFQEERDHQIDGIVIRLNDEVLYEALGATSHHPRGSIAFKQESEVAITEIIAIETSLGRSGKVTFRAQVTPVQLSGAQISYATLHNAEFIRAGGYAPGARVRITRSGEVIPSIIGLETPADHEYKFPETCPCGYQLTVNGPDLYCTQDVSCAPKDQEAFLYFAQTLEINGVSEKTIAKLRESGLLTNPSDFFRLTVDDFKSLDGFAQRSAENLVKSIQERRKIPLAVFLAALGLKRGGIVKCREVAARFSTLSNVLSATVEDLTQEKGWAEKSAQDFIESLRGRMKWITDLLSVVEVSEDITHRERAQFASHPLSGKSICITGALSQPREVYARKLEKIGAKVASSVTGKTHFLVCNEESSSSKYVQAKKLGIPVLKETELVEMLANESKEA
ncbi:MAG: hypothetical protein RJB13_2097 [Pseudomonadota bacterium]